MKIEGFVSNLLPNSQFGLHVHEQGDITSGCSSAGAHFNPYKKQVRVKFEKLLCTHRFSFSMEVIEVSNDIGAILAISEAMLLVKLKFR